MPMKDTSYPDGNGMIFGRGSHKAHLKAIQDGTWSKYSNSISGLLALLGFYRDLGESHEVSAPTLEPGDVVIFFKCTIHSSSVFDTFTMGSKEGVTLARRWHSDYALFTGVGSCDNGLVMWMPMKDTSYPDG